MSATEPGEEAAIYCPRAASDFSPCIARDGNTALADDGVCVMCGEHPRPLLGDLGERWPGAALAADELRTLDVEVVADRLATEVTAYIRSGGAS